MTTSLTVSRRVRCCSTACSAPRCRVVTRGPFCSGGQRQGHSAAASRAHIVRADSGSTPPIEQGAGEAQCRGSSRARTMRRPEPGPVMDDCFDRSATGCLFLGSLGFMRAFAPGPSLPRASLNPRRASSAPRTPARSRTLCRDGCRCIERVRPITRTTCALTVARVVGRCCRAGA